MMPEKRLVMMPWMLRDRARPATDSTATREAASIPKVVATIMAAMNHIETREADRRKSFMPRSKWVFSNML